MIREKKLYAGGSGGITQKDLEAALKRAGLEKGDIVMVHSDVGVFGKLGDMRVREEFLDAILSAFLNVLGWEGALILPTFTYSFCKGEIFDVKNTPSTVGILTEHLRKKKESIRSMEPIFSCAGIGRRSEDILNGPGDECFGSDSVFDRLYKLNGKLMLFGRPFDITYTHYVERFFGVSYRFDKVFSGTVIDENGNTSNKKVTYYVRYLDRDVVYDMEKIGNGLFNKKLLNKVKLERGDILSCRARDVFDTGMEMLKKDEHAFLAHPPKKV